ncbi:MAG: membrane protein [Candidatus Entotheonella factor]|uniref:Protein QmcA n=1 Tax=Entotheonella factor TaxID=1429438 RepID=W4LC98_ENTF1|nr:slipin family protein [Candidatus Entotheonella palauensis]ETW95612.1 MAG: membrane protein [Candidatus Entotheonella factor]
MPNMVFLIAVIVLILTSTIKVLREWERGVILRLGKFQGVRGPGIIIVIPIIERMFRLNTRLVTVDVPPQDIITKDNVTMNVNAVVFFRVLSPREAVVNVENFYDATYQKAQTVLRNVLGQTELDELLTGRDSINTQLQEILDAETDQWGIKVEAVEIKHVDLPQEMQRAMARQAEAERERRAKIISAEGEFQASSRLAEAADVMGQHPMSLQLRFLQTLSEVATENNSTLIFPVPIDLVKPLMEMGERMEQQRLNGGNETPPLAAAAPPEEPTPPGAQ